MAIVTMGPAPAPPLPCPGTPSHPAQNSHVADEWGSLCGAHGHCHHGATPRSAVIAYHQLWRCFMVCFVTEMQVGSTSVPPAMGSIGPETGCLWIICFLGNTQSPMPCRWHCTHFWTLHPIVSPLSICNPFIIFQIFPTQFIGSLHYCPVMPLLDLGCWKTFPTTDLHMR